MKKILKSIATFSFIAFVALLAVDSAEACNILGYGCGDTDEGPVYNYNEAFNQEGGYRGTTQQGEFRVDNFAVFYNGAMDWANTAIVSIFYNEAGEDSGSTIRRGNCVEQFDNQGQSMGNSCE